MNIKHIESFVLLSKELHYGKAAERLGISQPSLSQQMKALEADLGVELFAKKGRNISLTKAGYVFLQRALTIQKEINEAETEMYYFRGYQRESIRFGLSGSHLSMNIVREFTDCFPDTSLYITENSSIKTIDALLDKKLDIGIVYDSEEHNELTTIPLFYDELFVVLPFDHELAEKEILELNDLDNVSMILLNQDLVVRKFIDAQFKQHAVVPNIICELTNLYACVACVEKKLGVSLIVHSMLKTMNSSNLVTVKPIKDLSFHKTVNLVYRSDLIVDEPTAYLIEKIKNIRF